MGPVSNNLAFAWLAFSWVYKDGAATYNLWYEFVDILYPFSMTMLNNFRMSGINL